MQNTPPPIPNMIQIKIQIFDPANEMAVGHSCGITETSMADLLALPAKSGELVAALLGCAQHIMKKWNGVKNGQEGPQAQPSTEAKADGAAAA